jgi:hypothetical protein
VNKAILEKEVQAYLAAHLEDDPLALVLRKSPFPQITSQELAAQVASKKKSEKKLPTWFGAECIYYPPPLNLSQSSSERTAAYKASLVAGHTLADLTGGFGVDAHAFAKKFQKVFHLEQQPELSAMAQHNFKVLGTPHIEAIAGEGLEWLRSYPGRLDCIYVDPSRRDDSKKKVFLLEDCQPNVLASIDLLLQKSDTILIKTGPLLDISAGLHQLPHVAQLHIVAVDNEVKELLWLIQKGRAGGVAVHTRNFQKRGVQSFDFQYGDLAQAEVPYSAPLTHLYEPNAAIMKSGAFALVGTAFGVKKLHPNTHLYTSNEGRDFPGRHFRIQEVYPYKKSALKSIRPKKAHITTRNFRFTVAQLRHQTKVQEGGDDYLFFTTGPLGQALVIHAIKVENV